MNRVLSLWDALATKPLGKWFFSRIICWKAPYFATIKPRFEELRPGFSSVSMPNRRAVHNHLQTVHAIALCNLAEIGAGTMMEASLSENMRWLPKGMNVKYLKKAETDVVASCTAPDTADGESRESVVHVDIKDIHGTTVCHAEVIMWVSPKKSKTTG
ncbi:MAG: hotdog fold domain-containing protein [Burkholderiales bacterium]